MLAARVADEFGIPVGRLSRVSGGYDARARVWRGSDPDGGVWSIKETVRDCRFGLSIAAALGESGAAAISTPRRSRSGEPWSLRDGVLLSVAPWVVGVDAVDDGAEHLRWDALGATLRAVHDSPPPADLRPVRRGIRRTLESPAALVASVDDRMRQRLAPSSHSEDPADRAAALWWAHRDRIDALVRLERTLKKQRTPTVRVPLHGDPHPGNVIIDAARRPWLIDFDEATTAPREVDLMLIELGVIFSRPITDAQRRAFRDGYGHDAPVDESRLVRFGCVRAVEDLAATAHRLLDAPPDRRAPFLATLTGLVGPDGTAALVERRLAGTPTTHAAAATASAAPKTPFPAGPLTHDEG